MGLAADIAEALRGLFLTTRADFKSSGRVKVPGITPADALDANDVMGSLITFGELARVDGGTFTIAEARFYDFDDEGLGKVLYLFSRPVTLAASDAAWSLSDADLAFCLGKISFSTFDDHVNCQMSVVQPMKVITCEPGSRTIYGGVQTLGADSIALGADPYIELICARD